MIGNTIDRFVPRIFILAVIIMLPLLAACSGSNTVSTSDIQVITQGLNCVCGSCDEVLSECDCEKAEELTNIVKKGLSRGHSEEQIVQDLVRLYGQQVLASKSPA